ncbi:uncharacterized protein LOC144145717 isoform X2 [Haemaphysalis longicornis]
MRRSRRHRRECRVPCQVPTVACCRQFTATSVAGPGIFESGPSSSPSSSSSTGHGAQQQRLGVAKGRSSPPAAPQQWRGEDITQLSDDAFESVLRELVECKPQARSSSLVRSLRREVRDQEELFDGSLHALPPSLLSSSSPSSSSTARSHHHHPRPGGGGSVSLQDLASSGSMAPSGLLRPRGGGVPNPAGRGMRHVAVSRGVLEVRAGRPDDSGEGPPHSGSALEDDDESSKASAAVAALSCRTDDPPAAGAKLPLLVRPKPDVELVTLKNGSVLGDDAPLLVDALGGGPRRVATVRYDAFAKEVCSEKEAGIRMPTYGGEATTLAAIAHSRSRDGEPHTNNVAFSIRKNKKSRNHVDPTVMAEEMSGHRGSDSIDTLLAYIYSDDKGGAPHGANSNGGNGTAASSSDNRKGKNVRKSTPSSNAGGAKNSLSSPPPDTAGDKETQRGLSEDVVNNNFDSSHRRAVFEDAPLVVGGSLGEKERSFSPSFYSDYGIDTEPAGSYRVDLSSFSDVDQIQESEFRLVTKKQRRRAQLKKASTTACEGFQRQLGAGGAAHGATGNGPVEESSRRPGGLDGLSGQQQQPPRGGTQSMPQEPPATVAAGGGRQHNCTESAPPSEPSSPENSDLDSVHSLPVGGHASAATAAIAQTSYADIARMSCRARGGGGANGTAAAGVVAAVAENPVVPSQPETPVGPTSQGTEAVAVVEAAAPPTPPPAPPSRVEEEREEPAAGGDGSRSPPVVLLDDGAALPVPLGEITFGFDVNEQLVRMSLDSQFHSVPSGGGGTARGERGEPVAPAARAAAVASPRFNDGRPEELGRFNHRDVVDFLDWEWVRASQGIEKEGSADSKPRVLYYYCDSSSTGPRQRQNS